jgi:oligoendopeptidase F
MKTAKIPTRNEIPEQDKWDLSSLYLQESDWEMDLTLLPDLAKEILTYKGRLSESPDTLRNAMDSYCRLLMIFETTGNYAFLLTAGDAENPENQNKYGRYVMAATAAEAEISFFVPELQSIDEKLLQEWCQRPDFNDYKIYC